MNVVILSDHDHQGGAAVATCRIEASIDLAHVRRCAGEEVHDVQRVVFFRETAITPLTELWYEESPAKRALLRLPRKILPAFFPRPNTPRFAAKRLRAVLRKLRPDVINVHNLHAAAPWGWDPHLIEVCLEFAPVVWTLHDMWSFTGRCAYSYDCDKFITGCDASCPTPNEEPKLAPEKIRAAWEARQAIYARDRGDLVVVTPSRWLANQARRGLFAAHRIEVIPYGLTHPGQDPFQASPRVDARRKLGIQTAGPVLLLAAFDLTERRKGAEILRRLWQHVEHRPLTILTMGRGNITVDDPLIEVHSLGFIDDDGTKALAYSAADFLLHPAPVDNFPNVVLEALACGTPTVALPIGGVPEMVRPGISGWLAETATPEALARVVDKAIRDLTYGTNLRESCRALVAKEYSMVLQGRRYIELFNELRRSR